MNRQRIEELAEQSGLAQAADVRAGFIYPSGMEKFAELLIRECMDIVCDINQEYDGGSTVVNAAEEIREYFGVK
jgi:hypothetical protein